jgi:hypothetical protein
MKKLSLDLDSLRVDSFETLSARRGGGTVHALESPQTGLDSECCVDTSTENGVTCPNHTCSPQQTLDSTPACCV